MEGGCRRRWWWVGMGFEGRVWAEVLVVVGMCVLAVGVAGSLGEVRRLAGYAQTWVCFCDWLEL